MTALTTSAAKWDEIVKAIEAKPGGPAPIDAGGPYTATEGTALTLAGSGSGAAAWDLDADGEFDDATGFKPSVTFDRAGAYVIGVKAGDAVAYAVVRVADANHAPVLSAPVPADRMATITAGGALPLSVSASDPDSDPIDYSWTIDGAAADGHGATLTYSPAAAQVGSHTVEVTASDGTNRTRRAWELTSSTAMPTGTAGPGRPTATRRIPRCIRPRTSCSATVSTTTATPRRRMRLPAA